MTWYFYRSVEPWYQFDRKMAIQIREGTKYVKKKYIFMSYFVMIVPFSYSNPGDCSKRHAKIMRKK